ncbi:Gag-Pro-Pol polyprotein [Labeo rohita]|uniref:ribonuclease H n=1 Tax=Labeo rohita TaxID=84645 RepID=A0ABQ8LPR9_LABRO|nr:Gag-Pro-Pol polyprotein [Labeo rohita]
MPPSYVRRLQFSWQKDAIEPVPQAKMKMGFYSPYFIVPKKSGGLRPILDLRALNQSLTGYCSRCSLRSAFIRVCVTRIGRAYQYKVLPFGLSLPPCVFTKLVEGALAPLWGQGIRILNYLNDWLIIAHLRDLLCQHRDLVLQHFSHLGLRVNWEKSKLSPVQSISFLSMELDSVNITARLTNERRHKTVVPLKHFQRLLGHMAAAAAVMQLGLLHMRPLQHWLHDRIPRWAWHRGTFRVDVTPECCLLFSPWSDPGFLRAGVPLGQVSRHVVVNTDASTTGWGAICNGQVASGSWRGPRLH